MKSGLTLITEERLRHIDKGYTPSHDDQHKTGEIVAAARCYALLAETQNPGHGWTKAMVEDHIFENEEWPWDSEDWKPSESQTQNLIKAGAMIAAEIDRLHRLDYHHRRSDLNASGTRTYGECPSQGRHPSVGWIRNQVRRLQRKVPF